MGCFPKRISSISAERMPIGTGESKLIFHFLSRHQPVLIIPAKCHWVITIRAFILYAANVFEIFFFNCCGLHMELFYLLDRLEICRSVISDRSEGPLRGWSLFTTHSSLSYD